MENYESNPQIQAEKKEKSGDKIWLFIIGVLVGAVISTGAFFAYIKLARLGNNSNDQSMQMPNGTPPEMPSGNNSDNNQGGTPPEMPNGNNSSNNQNGTPPEKPSNSNSQNNNN